MKRQMRIKIMQEEIRAKNITIVGQNLSKNDSFKLREVRDNINKKIEFYKMMNRIIEECKNDKL